MRRVACTLASVLSLGLVSLVPPALAGAQGRDTVAAAPGALVRVRPVGDTVWRTGRLTALTADSLTLRACRGCGVPTLVRDQLWRVEVRRGVPGTRQRHMVIGMTAGALLAVGAGVVSAQRCDGWGGSDGPPCALGYTAVPLMAVAGLLGGAIIGAALPPERWHPVALGRGGTPLDAPAP